MHIERMDEIAIKALPRVQYVVELDLNKKDETGPRPDLGVGIRDFAFNPKKKTFVVTVHNIGAADAHPGEIALLSGKREIARLPVPALPAPRDLKSKRAKVVFANVAGTAGLSVTVDPDEKTR